MSKNPCAYTFARSLLFLDFLHFYLFIPFRSFMTVYNEAKKHNTIDPLGKYQIEMPEFDKVVESYHSDPGKNIG